MLTSFLILLLNSYVFGHEITEMDVYAFYDTRLELLCIATSTGAMTCKSFNELTPNSKEYIKSLIKALTDISKNKLKPGIIKIPKPYIEPKQ